MLGRYWASLWGGPFLFTCWERGAINGAYEMNHSKTYDIQAIEHRLQRAWEEAGLYRTDLDGAARPFYNLMEFPYPSGEGLHVGHFFSFSGADTYGRYQRMKGNDVFQPMGFDAFGIHAENYALKLGINPARLTPRNVRRFREEQLQRMGAAFDWSREVNTTDPRYYRWTQWIFTRLYEGGLAYRAAAPVNWCPSCLTTLADEQVIAGHCERCDAPVERRALTQWFFRITSYAERLLDFSGADFADVTRRLQTHWIGRKEGAEVYFRVADGGQIIITFSTRADTLYGVTFLVLSPQHPLATTLATDERRAQVLDYIERSTRQREGEQAPTATKTGVWTGRYAINPVNGQPAPIWVADYVLSDWGAGAIFAVPAHDQRDFEFAQAHGLPIVPVVRPPDAPSNWPSAPLEAAYEGDGVMIHSGPYDGMSTAAARQAIVSDLAARGQARLARTYRLRDWLISRQRYWGPPIPIVYCDHCGQVSVPASDLPVLLPETEQFRPLGTGQSPLAAIPGFAETTCPCCGGPARRETDVSDNFLDSAWYFLRYTSTEFDDRPWDVARLRRWLPVSTYFGGIEHSTLHHLYARFLWKALQDLGHIPVDLGPEPFAQLKLHGLIIKDGRRMSKSRGNVINPDEYVARYGADVLRVYMLFMGPFEEGGDFRDVGIPGVVRFLNRVWRLVVEPAEGGDDPAQPLIRAMHRAIRQVTRDLEGLAFNTAISQLMGYASILADWQGRAAPDMWGKALRALLLMLAPFAPHLAEELWSRQGGPFSIHRQLWPAWDEALAEEETITLVVQVDSRVRDRIAVPADLTENAARALVLASERVRAYLVGRDVAQVIYVPGKLVNLVTRET